MNHSNKILQVARFLVIMSCLCTTQAFSEDSTQALAAAARSEITTIVKQLVREIDPAAQVIVTTSKQTANGKLNMPGTPFVLNDVNISGTSESGFDSVRVTVFTSLGELPSNVEQLISEMVSSYSTDVQLSVKRLPEDFLAARKEPRTVVPNEAKARSWEALFAELLAQISSLLKKSDKIEVDSIGKLALLIGVSFTLSVFLIVFIWMRMQRRTLAVMEQGFKEVAAAMEASSGGAGRELPAATGLEQAAQRQLSASQPSDRGQSFASIPESSLLALLADCYWTNQDRYGAFLWRRIPIERKICLIERMPELSEYGRFLSKVVEEDLGMEQDPCYLQPLPLWHLDMECLTDIVRHNHAFISKLSPIRLSALHLKPTERLALYESSKNSGMQAIPVLPDSKSAPRQLNQSLQIDIQSEADEIEILAIKDTTIELIEQVPSLGWLLQLPAEKISEILQPLSARDIATAWVGPLHILEKIAQHIGEKKLKIMKSYLGRLTPGRNTPAFVSIHRRTVEEIQRIRGSIVEVSEDAA